MLAILSPSKTLNYDIHPQTGEHSQPQFLAEADELAAILKKYSPSQLQNLMNINPKLAELNATRYMQWQRPFTPENAMQALLVFKGEVFNGLKAESLTEGDLLYAQNHLRILSGL
ncbi:MAG: YaaA family protein, partial [Bacteroidales bacterium]